MTIAEAEEGLFTSLLKIYDSREAKKITAMVLEKITNLTVTERLINKKEELNFQQQEKYYDLKRRLLQFTPIQYILNEAWFCGLRFYVDENVLIPRPETEELVETVIKEFLGKQHIKIIDIGTGSGCIAISLKNKLPDSTVYALDISEKALIIAERNAKENNAKINFIEADILQSKNDEVLSGLDVVVSNPPYITEAEAGEMANNVLLHEPHLALFVTNANPLIFYEAIAVFALKNLKPKTGKLFVEINEMFGGEVMQLLQAKGFVNVIVQKDLQHKNRIVVASLP